MHLQDTPSITLPMAVCPHTNTISYDGATNCSLCGAYMQASPISHQMKAFKLPKGVRNRLEVSPLLIYENMIKNEKEPPLTSPVYIKTRKSLVDALCSLGEKLRLSTEVIHISVLYMDQILNTFEIKGIKPDKFPLVSVACLIVAAKYYELDRHIPFIEDYSRLSKARLSVPSLKEYERHILNWLNWDLSATPPSIYVQMISLQGLSREDDKSETEVLKPSHLSKMAKFTELFADFVVGDSIFVQKKMSVIAAGCIMAARKAVKVDPIWNKELEKLCKYKQCEIEEVSRVIFNSYYSMISFGKECIEWPACKDLSHKDKENILEPNKSNSSTTSTLIVSSEKETFNLEEHKKNLENMKSTIESKLSVLDHQSKSLEMLIS